MDSVTVAGIDPGIIHTGLVVLEFGTAQPPTLTTHAVVIDGLDAGQTRADLEAVIHPRSIKTVDIFIEQYRPRSGFGTNDRMMWANTEFPSVVGGRLLRNEGVVKIVTKELLELLGLWHFKQTSHHQDLRSAARIAVLGMMRDEYLNQVLYTYTTNRLDNP